MAIIYIQIERTDLILLVVTLVLLSLQELNIGFPLVDTIISC